MKSIRRLRKVLRAVVLSLLIVAVVLPVGVYVILSTPWAQDKLRGLAERELTGLLGSPVAIGRVDYEPFNTLSVTSVSVADASGQPALAIGRLQARFELFYFLRTHRLVFDYALVEAPEVHLWRDTPGSPLNIQPILDRLKPKEPGKPPTQFDLNIGVIAIRHGRFTYDVRSIPDSLATFNPSHIAVSDFRLHGWLKKARPDEYVFDLEALSLKEKSGLDLRSLTASAAISDTALTVTGLTLELPGSSLSLNPIELRTPGLMKVREALESEAVDISFAAPMIVSTADFGWISPEFMKLDRELTVDLDASASLHAATLHSFTATDGHGVRLDLSGSASGLGSPDELKYELHLDRAELRGADAAALLGRIDPGAGQMLARAGGVSLSGTVHGSPDAVDLNLRGKIGEGSLEAVGLLSSHDRFKSFSYKGSLALDALDAGAILAQPKLGTVSLEAEADFALRGKIPTGTAAASVSHIIYNGHAYTGIDVDAANDGSEITLVVNSADPAADFSLDATGNVLSADKWLNLDLDLRNLDPAALNISCPRPGLRARGKLVADLAGSSADDIEGEIRLTGMRFTDAVPDTLDISKFIVTATRDGHTADIGIESDFLNGTIAGRIVPSTLPAILREMASHIVPSLFPHDGELHDRLAAGGLHNDFNISLIVANAEHISRFLHLPVTLIHPVDISADIDSEAGTATFLVDAPYLQQGDKIIDSTVAGGNVDIAANRATVYATTHMPTKKGPMTAVLGISGADSRFDTKIDWNIDRKIPLNGKIDFSTLLGRSEGGNICVDTRFNPGQVNFGDDVWQIAPSRIDWCDGRLGVDGFGLTAGPQKILIDGTASTSPDDIITVTLDSINLISIFETLEIENALLTGTATGTFTASQALSKIPLLSTDNLHVDNIGYNYCVLGDADISASWNNDRQSFYLDADIVNPEGQHSRIAGDIFAAGSLDLDFNATHVKVGFMQPFMSAFASDISGFASGHARLFGTFHDIDMEGDIFAEDLRLRIDFTNTYYTATDSIHIRPGRIQLDDITLHDINGHTAKLNGVLTHDFFHRPVFDFRITDAHDFLAYNVTSKINPDWYGTIYGNGGATVKGKPGEITIGVDMATAPGSTFTFVLSDRLEAEQYSFITFNDVTQYSEEEILSTREDIPEAVREYQQRMKAQADDRPSNYIMDIRVDITPDARVNLVMDPVGGDCIRANGSGDLRMTYDAYENDLRMYGTYTLDRGSYNFTLQDIIIKDFTINPGSSIAFRGDPYSAQLDLQAVYQVNANLSDLDESFTQDKDLNRTNVPVQALLKVSGDMRQPDISFDLRFPTLTSDTYRKVRSIISTDEMMNRQIIYLLALNRFYTPDYMASTTKGNELFSVASSTIASQLSSMLGKLSDNWSIAPNLRSDRGDFSDVEVDVALSSRLLNNRLLFNGNFGYRDKSLNTNQFVGDFDIEYLLTPRGTWRLKAYNRYNDQNYYVRTATTTQGVGIMFRRDFDSLFPRRKPARPDTIPADTTSLKDPKDLKDSKDLKK